MMTKQELYKRRGELLETLRRVDAEGVAELEQVDVAIDAVRNHIAKDVPREFTGLEIFSAIRLYLGRANHPISEPELIHALTQRGIQAKGVRPVKWRIAHSISYHAKNGNLRMSNQMVSLPEWEE